MSRSFSVLKMTSTPQFVAPHSHFQRGRVEVLSMLLILLMVWIIAAITSYFVLRSFHTAVMETETNECSAQVIWSDLTPPFVHSISATELSAGAAKHIPALLDANNSLPLSSSVLRSSWYHARPLSADVILQCYFSDEVQQYPTVLSYQPRVDCYSGRYLYYEKWENDGFGSSVALWSNVIAQAITLNVTIVQLPMRILHEKDESLDDRVRWLGISLFEVNRTEYNACPQHSPVKQNTLLISKPGTHFRAVAGGVDLGEEIRKARAFLDSIPVGEGATILVDTNGFTGSGFFLAGIILEIRMHALHPNVPALTGAPVNAEWEMQYSPRSAYIHTFPSQHSIMVAVHIRRGDLVEKRVVDGRNVFGVVRHHLIERIVVDDAYAQLIQQFHKALAPDIQNRLHYTIYSEGELSDFEQLTNALPIKVSIILNGPTTAVYEALCHADVIIGALSSFTYSASGFNSYSIKILPTASWVSDRFHFIRNIIQSKFNTNIITKDEFNNNHEFISLHLLKQTWEIENINYLILQINELIKNRHYLYSYNHFKKFNFQLNYNDSIYPHHRVFGYQRYWPDLP